MIRRLIILLLIVGCVFGDTIVFKTLVFKDGFSDVEYLGILNNKVYYLQHNVTYSINCNKVTEIINSDGKKINYDCLSNTYQSNKNQFISSGKKLIEFKNQYFRGFYVNVFGNMVFLNGFYINNNDTKLAGAGIMFIGQLVMLISFIEAGEAGEFLIDAGEKLETE